MYNYNESIICMPQSFCDRTWGYKVCAYHACMHLQNSENQNTKTNTKHVLHWTIEHLNLLYSLYVATTHACNYYNSGTTTYLFR